MHKSTLRIHIQAHNIIPGPPFKHTYQQSSLPGPFQPLKANLHTYEYNPLLGAPCSIRISRMLYLDRAVLAAKGKHSYEQSAVPGLFNPLKVKTHANRLLWLKHTLEHKAVPGPFQPLQACASLYGGMSTGMMYLLLLTAVANSRLRVWLL
jgi:hypothetical protein